MSTRTYDHCTFGHNRKDHEDFQGECENCKCDVFHRSMYIHSLLVE